MIVACEKCQTRFNVPEDRIKDAGSKVRCSQCKHVFTIYKPEAAPEPPKPAAPPVPPIPAPVAAPVSSPEIDDGPDDFLKDLGGGPGGKMDDDLTAMFGDDFGESIPAAEPKPKAAPPAGGMDLDALDRALAGDDDMTLAAEPKSGAGAGEFDFKSLEEDLALEDELDFPTPTAPAGKTRKPADDFGLEEETADFGVDDLDATIEAGMGEPGMDEGEPKKPDLFVPPALAKELMKQKPRDEEEDEEEGERKEEDEFDSAVDDDIASMAEKLAEKPARKSRALMWVLVVILLLVAAGGGVYYFAPNLLTPLGLGPKPPVETDPAGNKKISLSAEKHFFRQNNHAGQILVITGLAANGYDQPRRFLRLKGLLNDAKGAVLVERQVFCGNVLSEDELTVMTVADIQKMLNVKAGQSGSNLNVGPGQSVKFMIVFDAIPNNLAEYTVEAAGSDPIAQK